MSGTMVFAMSVPTLMLIGIVVYVVIKAKTGGELL